MGAVELSVEVKVELAQTGRRRHGGNALQEARGAALKSYGIKMAIVQCGFICELCSIPWFAWICFIGSLLELRGTDCRIFLQTRRSKSGGKNHVGGAHIVQISIQRIYDVLVVRVE